MVQTSLTAWLRKPASVTAPPPPTSTLTSPIQINPLPPAKRDATSAFTPALPASDNAATQTSPPAAKNSALPKHFASSLPPLPPNVELVPLTAELLPSFKRLNSLMLPMAYPTSFYKETMEDEVISSITLVALWHDTPPNALQQKDSPAPAKPHLIGAIRCRLLGPEKTLYISTLSLLPPYRSHGIATHLLQWTLSTAVDKYGITSITAHVWESNTEALEWYAKRAFKEEGREEGYYRKLRPSTAVLVRRWVGVGDLLGASKG